MFERRCFLSSTGNETFLSFSSSPSVAPRKVEFIGAAIGAAASIAGGIASGAMMNKAKEQYENAHAENSAYYKRLMSENYLDTAAGQETVRQARETMKAGTNQAAGAAAFGGASDSSVGAARESANKQVGSMMGGIAANDVQRKDAAGNALANENNTYASNMASIYTQKANNISQAAQGVANAAGSMKI